MNVKRFGPLFLCGFRPFFLAATLIGLLGLLAWGGFFLLGIPLPTVTGGPMIWHAHEMIFGFGVAALVGFLLTAAPEFTETASIRPVPIAVLLALWLLARLGYLIGGHGQWLTAIAEIMLLSALAALIAPRLWRDPDRHHLGFLWAVLLLVSITVGFHVNALWGGYPMRWLLAATGVFMALIVLAMSRISMRVVNDELARHGQHEIEYLSRPPRRNLAVFCISAYTLAELIAPLHPVSGWLALAAAAAMLNLTNDWHLGRALFYRWIFMLYLIYWAIALGYLAMGLTILGDLGHLSAGRHLLLIGGLGGAVFMVMNIAGRIHAGLELERRRWVPIAMGLLVAAALLRALATQPNVPYEAAMVAAIVAWLVAFALLATYLAPWWFKPRRDNREGCAGPP